MTPEEQSLLANGWQSRGDGTWTHPGFDRCRVLRDRLQQEIERSAVLREEIVAQRLNRGGASGSPL